MRRLLPVLIALLGFTLLAAYPASAASLHAEKVASWSATNPNNVVSTEARLSDEAVRENIALGYDVASDDAVAARGGAGAVKEGAAVFRVFGGEARGLGKSWTTVNPGEVANFRRGAGLFPGNTGQFVIEGRLTNTEGVLLRDALRGPSGVGGGLPELVIPNPGSQVCLICVSGANPPF